MLDAEESEKTRKSNINEIVTVIAETFVELAANGKVIFILDDTQWIDPESLELFKLLLIKLDKDFNDNEVSFILTSRPVAPTDSMKELLAELANSINLDCTLNQDLLEKPEMVEGILESLRMDYRCRTSFSRYLLENGISRPLQILQFLEAAIDSDMIEAIGEVFALKSDSDLKKLPPPRDFQRMVEEHVSGLPAKLLDILQCCALMGRSFKASIVSRIFNIDLLELLTLFKNAEERNIICDVESEDDVFDFVDKRMVAVFRRLNSGATVAVSEALSQKVREYHKRFLQYKEQELKEMNLAEEDYPYRDLISLAAHSKAIADTNPEKAVQLNRLAGLRTYEKGMFQAATGYFETAVNLVDKHPGKYDPITEARLYLSYAKCLLDEQSNLDTVKELLAKGSKALENLADEKAATILPELNIVSALVAYRSRQFAEATELATKVVQSEKATVFEVLRARFYIAASLPIDQPEERFSQHTNLIHDIRERLKQENSPREERELQCVLSEALNNTGFIALFGLKDLAKAIPYFEKAIECNELPQVNDQKGIAIAHGGLGDCYSQLDKIQEAEVHYTTNLGISRNTGDLQGIGRMTSMLGALKLKEASTDGEGTESLIQNAFAFYDESLSISDNQGNGVGQCFAIAGLLNCLAIGHVGDRETYIIQKAKKIAQSPNYSKIPDFASSALVAALQKNREQNNSIEEVLVQLEK